MSAPTDTAPLCEPNIEDVGGLDLNTIYHLAQQFVTEKAEKAFHLSFENRIILSALGFQVKYGKYDSDKTPDPGFFDFIGRRRIAQWKCLGDMSTEDAKRDFVHRIEQLCPLFRSYLEAYSRNTDKVEPHLCSESKVGLNHPDASPFATSEDETIAFLKQYEPDIRAALNVQTREQFQQYAMQQYPTDAAKRAELITHLQDRHFHEYVSYTRQCHAAMKRPHHVRPDDPGRSSSEATNHASFSPGTAVRHNSADPMSGANQNNDAQRVSSSPTHASPSDSTQIPNGYGKPTASSSPSPPDMDPTSPVIPEPTELNGEAVCQRSISVSLVRPATIWTRSEVQEFKANLATAKDSVVRIDCGEIITIRVPAYPSGSSIVWEFATDDYDIGFGLYFEWEVPASEHSQDTSSPASVATADEAGDTTLGTTEEQPASKSDDTTDPNPTSLIDEIVPVFRRNSHQEIHCGSHVYPGLGTYLFKFDNSYSLWRAKMLYYRVYYTC